jgi:hypothetical protein
MTAAWNTCCAGTGGMAAIYARSTGKTGVYRHVRSGRNQPDHRLADALLDSVPVVASPVRLPRRSLVPMPSRKWTFWFVAGLH